jgi:hypothetical protein
MVLDDLTASKHAGTLLGISRLPAPDRGSADARTPRHFPHGQAVGRIKDYARPLHVFERTIAIRDDGQQTLKILGARKDTDGLSPCPHTRTSARISESRGFCEVRSARVRVP